MRTQPASMSVTDYCENCNNGKIVINNEYQRNVGLWSTPAKSFFIESILLEYPIPMIYLHVRTDLKSRQQVKDVVDGQQRTQALVSFFNNKLRLSNSIDTEELRGLKYDQIDPVWQSRFLFYNLPIDQFPVATDEEIQESFRRMNANNVPLNDEEQRNARFQGPFKWFMIRFADKYKEPLRKLGLFTRRDLIRMNDLKVYSEITLAVDQGFHTVKGTQIDNLYKRYNAVFSEEQRYEDILSGGIEGFLSLTKLHQDLFLRGHIFQSIILAIIDKYDYTVLDVRITPEQRQIIERIESKKIPLSTLLDALADPDAFSDLKDFTSASTTRTNVELAKLIRFSYLKSAIRML